MCPDTEDPTGGWPMPPRETPAPPPVSLPAVPPMTPPVVRPATPSVTPPTPPPVTLPNLAPGAARPTPPPGGPYGTYDSNGAYIPFSPPSPTDSPPQPHNRKALAFLYGGIAIVVALVIAAVSLLLASLGSSDDGPTALRPSATRSPSATPSATPTTATGTSSIPSATWTVTAHDILDLSTSREAWLDDIQDIAATDRDAHWTAMTAASRLSAAVARIDDDGSIAWTYPTSSNTFCAPELFQDQLVCLTPWSAYGQHEGTGTSDNWVYRLDATTGEEVGKTSLTLDLQPLPVAVHDGVLYIVEQPLEADSTADSYLTAVEVTSGQRRFREPIGLNAQGVDLVFGDDFLSALDDDGGLHVLSLADGSAREIPADTTYVLPTSGGMALLDAATSTLTAVSDDGSHLWQTALPDLWLQDASQRSHYVGDLWVRIVPPQTAQALLIGSTPDGSGAPSDPKTVPTEDPDSQVGRVAWAPTGRAVIGQGYPFAPADASQPTLLAIDLATGHIDWQYSDGLSYVSAQRTSASTISLIAYDTTADYAVQLDSATGQALWTTKLTANDWIQEFRLGSESLLAVVSDRSGPNTVLAMDPATGEIRWSAPITTFIDEFWLTAGNTGVALLVSGSQAANLP